MSNLSVPEFFVSANRFGIRMGLERMRALCAEIGNPQDALSCIHVAGTNGKGAVVSYISSVLAENGFRVGVYTSPYLERFSERIRIMEGRKGLDMLSHNGAAGEVPYEWLHDRGRQIEEAVHRLISQGMEHPTEFELVTCAAFLYFRENHCDYVVLETGLGGRLDSTNIIKSPIATIITAIGYDHTDRLGATIEEIAHEKAGIIKEHVPVFLLSPHDVSLTDEEAEAVERVIRNRCDEMNAPLTIVSGKEISERISDTEKQSFILRGLPGRISISKIGYHQALNAALAAYSLRSLVPKESIQVGISKSVWRGRTEIISQSPLILLDGAHNVQGIKALCAALEESFAKRLRKNPPRLMVGVMRDKDYEEMLRILLLSLSFPFREIICVTVNQERSLPALELADAVFRTTSSHPEFYKDHSGMYNIQSKIFAYDDAEKAVKEVISKTLADGSPILCVGSLYLIGQIRHVCIDYVGGEKSDGLG